MKTAEKWSKTFNIEYRKLEQEANEKVGEDIVPHEHILRSIIEQIQLDAWKQGMSDAEHCKPSSASTLRDEKSEINWSMGYNECLDEYSQSIIKLRDSKTTI